MWMTEQIDIKYIKEVMKQQNGGVLDAYIQ